MVRLFKLKVTLIDSEPSVWRSVLVRDELILSDFHFAMQIIFGWQNAHLHQWLVPTDGKLTQTSIRNATYYANADMGLENTEEADWVCLYEVLREPKHSIIYEYDMGDSWRHAVTLEEVLPFDGKTIVKVLDGKHAAPPEDSGGVYGFPDLMAAAKNRKHPDHVHAKDWLGDWDANAFDLDAINAALAKAFKE